MGKIELFTAKQANEAAITFNNMNLNTQRQCVLEDIKRKARHGKSSLILDDPSIRLYDSDYVFFEKLGYKVERSELKYFVPYDESYDSAREKGTLQYERKFGSISW